LISAFAVAGQLPQLPDRLGRHEARPEQPRLEQLAQPGRVRDIGLAAGDLLDVAGVDQQQLEVVLEHRPDRLPIDAGRLHRHLPDPMRLEPVAQRQQPAHRRLELHHLLLARAALAGDAHAGGHLRLVHIQRRRALDDHLHDEPP